jgi:flagellar hook-associated protein 3 FlgL
MPIRPTQASLFSLVRGGLLGNASKAAIVQEQIASGRRILRPSDDPIGLSLAASLRAQIARGERFGGALESARGMLDAAASAVQGASELMTQAREALLSAMNGSLSSADRAQVATQIRSIRDQLLDVANQQFQDRYLFAGTATSTRPFASTAGGVAYAGNEDAVELLVGVGATISESLPGSEVFAKRTSGSTRYAGSTGAASAAALDSGEGYEDLELRHDATSGTLSAGVAFAAGGSLDTILGDHALTVDAAAATVRLDSGEIVAIPPPGDPAAGDVRVLSEKGAELHLDFTGFTGASFTATVTGAGSASLDGNNYVPLDFAEDDIAVTDSLSGAVIHLDARGIHRSGVELVAFGGTANVFDVLEGIAQDLENGETLGATELTSRLNDRLLELDRNAQNIRQALGTLGTRSASTATMKTRLEDADLELQGLLSSVEDLDFSAAVLDLAQAQQALQATQAASARILQTSLLNFLAP